MNVGEGRVRRVARDGFVAEAAIRLWRRGCARVRGTTRPDNVASLGFLISEGKHHFGQGEPRLVFGMTL
ncbi:hypothetical protein GCM10022221_33410 [Actinocorallia aurea]